MRPPRAPRALVETFSVPPAMAERGLDGAAVASLFLDKLSALQAQTCPYREAETLAPRWGALHLAWGDALAGLGRRDEAQARWREAAAADPASARKVSEAKLLAATLGR